MKTSRTLGRALRPLLLAGGLLVMWELAVHLFKVPTLVLPAPTQIAVALWNGLKEGIYTEHVAATLSAMAVGYFAGSAAGFALGAALAEWRAVERLLYPVIIAFQSVPKIALAPLFVMWFGFGLLSKVVTVALLCFFPLLVNTMAGIAATDPDRVALLRALSASRWQVFLQVKLPSAAGAIFAGLQVSVVLALIGALVAEFIGSDRGLGIVIEAARANLDTPGMFAALLITAAIGLSATYLVQFIQHRVIFWERREAFSAAQHGEQG
jgi:NitT/TauT family transport system permease protein